ncbi:MAG: M20/M25/M40 family metallo-hydrolase [Bacteroidetes bacterium]|nr:M20/M25/M40 family metallo-hydrolase [Bacteroidota bacterium]
MTRFKVPCSMKTLFSLAFFFALTLSFCQKSIDTVALIDLQRHLKVLASDAMEGRETGTPGIEKAAVYLEKEFLRLGLSPGNGKKYRQEYRTPQENLKAYNIIAHIDGSTFPNEYVVVSAHYDHLGIDDGIVYNGADDNGSGTAALLAMAGALMRLKKTGVGPQRTVVFIAFSGEEKGLWGSSHFSDHPTLLLDKVSCNINIDMIGRIDPDRITADSNNYVCIVGQSRISSETQLILRALNDNTQQLTLDGKFDRKNDPNRIFYRSDHYNFAKKGVPVVFFYDGMLGGDYHQPTDDITFIDWDIYHKRTNFILDFIMALANRENLLKRNLAE